MVKWWVKIAILNKMVREGLTFKQRPEGGRGTTHGDSWGQGFQKKSKSKGPTVKVWDVLGPVRRPVRLE